jgi:7-carboxy-7-deazaguanine synthase
MKISEDYVFFSIQGEGESIGKPAIFLRLFSCNLKCCWCDSKYTWGKNHYLTESISQVAKDINKIKCDRLIITGGEPLLQQKAISSLIKKLPTIKYIEIETNGTINPDEYLIKKCFFNVSPKLSNSKNSKSARYKKNILKNFNKNSNCSFKFVVKNKKNLNELTEILRECKIENNKIIIVPEGRSTKEMKKNSLSLIESAKNKGWRILPRIHILFWNNKKGI